ncbi:serine/threonine/tyrosine-interacting-like protein 1 isoform X5 [Mus musculus]|nr:serine/threonine/tyrosine-interacting-like protein 1 isoform X5 [Mus musculus]XP_017176636.1 serine/threonine/tyrosine-interacting-like protein 1 isoform X5 [Mus musculus]XP_017176637.1 serine/threonine/tyrosine-interacting-like protein 1 isoform X5 [Mus musculus]XP_017176638.1 serine/threonine/tyrosine-interacting-like protein 1 isoform X5 [Mus musculus]XP_017176639.1 serine/threonine/tyrosine-interacting-like protein 1 isoform X5 [Mus musculus]XP_017176640.1 serine/threonine/tyrosine-inte|eukprot:XP_017176635.1 PREDICTED: serine/threonine/tyrosine-interacting-like protein 1 isoform X5 [Mus musculus]
MADLLFCEPTELYNILNQVSKLSRLAEPNYLCLLDVRSKRQYDESHVITALRVKKRDHQYLIPESVDLECVRYCIVYDSNTSSLELCIRRQLEEEEEEEEVEREDKEEDTELLPGPAVEFGQILIHFTRQPVYVLRGGYECFSGMYHFFRTQKIIWMPQELDAFQPYPVEILPGRVYLGKISQACNAKMHKDLKIKAHVNISMETTPYFIGNADKLLHIKLEDSPDTLLFDYFRHICHFIELHLRLHSVVLVFSTRGISRSVAAVVALLMHYNEETLKSRVPARGWSCPPEKMSLPSSVDRIKTIPHGQTLRPTYSRQSLMGTPFWVTPEP